MTLLRGTSLLLLLCLTQARAADLLFTGYARSLDTGALLYVESHAVSGAGTSQETRVVLYRCTAESAPFARKELDYRADRMAPSFALDDVRSGFAEGLTRDARGLTVFERRGASAPRRSEVLASAGKLVADSGFDEFVRTRWDALASGDAQTITFVVPSRLGTVKFKVRKVETTTIDGATASVFRLSLAGALGWLLPDIDVSYRDSDRRLLRYRGMTNLRDAEGSMISAQIDFPDTGRGDAPVDLPSLRALALVASCR